MANAATAVAREVERLKPRSVLVLAGLGNNGGDGVAMADRLDPEIRVRVLVAGPAHGFKTAEARGAAASLDTNRVPLEPYRNAERAKELAADVDLVVDALLGVGIEGELREPVRTLVDIANRSGKPILSIDVPTGLGTKRAIKPRVTVTFHDKKTGMSAANSGRILVRDIGIPDAANQEVGPADFFATYPQNKADSHKGRNGRVLVVAGGPYTGAPILCAQAALRGGVDLVHLYAPAHAAAAAQAAQPDLIVHRGRHDTHVGIDDATRIAKLLPRVDTLLMGPGLGNEPSTDEAIRHVLRDAAKARIRCVLDADALAVAGRDVPLLKRLRGIATPHAGEYKELTGTKLPAKPKDAVAAAQRQAKRLGTTLLVKGPQDIITDGQRAKVNRIHHPAMTTGGTGDVLAGLTAAFLSKGMEPFRSACAAAFVNGDAGQHVAKRQGGTLLATDLIAEVPNVFQRWLPNT